MTTLQCLRSVVAALRAAAEVLERDINAANENDGARPAPKLAPLGADWVQDVLTNLPALVTTSEAAKVLRMSSRNVSRLLARGQLSSVRTGFGGSSRVLIARVEIARFLRHLEV